jgi:hypothetical protein
MEQYPAAGEPDDGTLDPNDPHTIEGAIHAAVEKEAETGVLKEGDRFSVKEIFGEVGPHNSPWHITYTALIEKVSA